MVVDVPDETPEYDIPTRSTHVWTPQLTGGEATKVLGLHVEVFQSTRTNVVRWEVPGYLGLFWLVTIGRAPTLEEAKSTGVRAARALHAAGVRAAQEAPQDRAPEPVQPLDTIADAFASKPITEDRA